MAAVAMMKLVPLALSPRMTLATNIKAEKQVPSTQYDTISFNRRDFPERFIFGTAGASYQYEGAVKEGGRGPSIWDTFTHKYPERIADHSNADVTIDQYHLYKEDVKLMKDMGLDSYRFSISWSRLLPNGKLCGGVSKEGVEYYNNLIDQLVRHGITPCVTIFHWDLPQALEDEYGGFLSPDIIKDYEEYAELCFKLFGDRVKRWITFNEPSMFSQQGYASGTMAPGRCSTWENAACTAGDSGTEPYLVTHHILLAHAAAVRLYRDIYKASQEGQIGITLVSHWFLPISDTSLQKDAASRALDFMLGWYMDPLTHGEYPHSMRALVGPRLPEFTREQSELLIKSFDFIGLNYYTTQYAADAPQPYPLYGSYLTDSRVKTSTELNGIPIGPQTGSTWLHVCPKGIYDILVHIRNKYQDPIIYITENGVSQKNDPTLTLAEALQDVQRIDYHYHHLKYLDKAIKDGVRVQGYYVWSLFDNFEWNSGYTVRFGIIFVDYDNLQRHPKLSSYWFKSFLQKSKREPRLPSEIRARKDLSKSDYSLL